MNISDQTLEALFPATLTDVQCIDVDKKREVWVGTEMCAHYLESSVDAITVRDENNKIIGIIGGYDLLDNIRKNPTRDYQYDHFVDEIMFKDVPLIDKKTTFGQLIEKWKSSRRAFALIPNESGDYSAISARKMLDLGKRTKINISASSMPKKKNITFKSDDNLGKVLDLMFENKTRKLLLEDSEQFISDRLIVTEISRVLKFQQNVDNFLEIPVKQLKLDYVNKISDDLGLNQICTIMDKMDHPFVMYEDIVISPWDVCLALNSKELEGPIKAEYRAKVKCPHCGKDVY